VPVSNFVLPLYFTSSHERGGRNDFLGTITDGKTLRSFSVNPGGYIGFFDPVKNEHVTVAADERGPNVWRPNDDSARAAGAGVRNRSEIRWWACAMGSGRP
jgi:hypothetical protein